MHTESENILHSCFNLFDSNDRQMAPKFWHSTYTLIILRVSSHLVFARVVVFDRSAFYSLHVNWYAFLNCSVIRQQNANYRVNLILKFVLYRPTVNGLVYLQWLIDLSTSSNQLSMPVYKQVNNVLSYQDTNEFHWLHLFCVMNSFITYVCR